MSESQTVVVPIAKAPKAIQRAVKHEALKEAFDNLLADPKFRYLTRKQIRALAKTQVDRMFKELRSLKEEEAAEAEAPSTDGPSTNEPSHVTPAGADVMECIHGTCSHEGRSDESGTVTSTASEPQITSDVLAQ